MKRSSRILLCFDLDFTLIDNREGIVNSFNYALRKYNLPEIDKLQIEKMIGIPLDIMFAKVSNLNPSMLSSTFREYYASKGIFQVKLISGVKIKLEELKNSFILGVITSKKQEMAVKLLKYLKIFSYFDFILGENENIKSKTDQKLIAYLLNNYSEYKFVIIGDHPNDKKLAETLNYCPFIGVLTGYHVAEQLNQDSKSKILILNSVNQITEDKIFSLF